MFSSSRNGPFNTLLQASAESGATPELLLDAGVGNWLNDWSRDGQFALYAADAQATSGDLGVLPLTGDRKPRPFQATPDYESGGAFSPDGRWIAYGPDSLRPVGGLHPLVRRRVRPASNLDGGRI